VTRRAGKRNETPAPWTGETVGIRKKKYLASPLIRRKAPRPGAEVRRGGSTLDREGKEKKAQRRKDEGSLRVPTRRAAVGKERSTRSVPRERREKKKKESCRQSWLCKKDASPPDQRKSRLGEKIRGPPAPGEDHNDRLFAGRVSSRRVNRKPAALTGRINERRGFYSAKEEDEELWISIGKKRQKETGTSALHV